MKITDYTILSSEYLSKLEVAIKSHIDGGWQPYGNLIKASSCYGYIQPMIRIDRSDEDIIILANELAAKRIQMELEHEEN
jgi:hypothetical protein